MPLHDQGSYDIRCEWGLEGLGVLSPTSDCIVVVDILSFTTCVTLAIGNGATVMPFAMGDRKAAEAFARSNHAELAVKRSEINADYPFSLSPQSMQNAVAGDRIVLPSPNGSTICGAADATGLPVIAGSLLNAGAVAEAASALGPRVTVIAAGERWPSDGALRPAAEDLVGAGAIIGHLSSHRSPEAEVAQAAFERASARLGTFIADTVSGRELRGVGYSDDVAIAANLDVTNAVPIMRAHAFERLR
jgi:2-phosphosulfolactate phosphatase